MSSDPEWEKILQRIASRAKPRFQAPPEKPPKTEKPPRIKRPLTLCEHGLRKWPTATKPYCHPCWKAYLLLKYHERQARLKAASNR